MPTPQWPSLVRQQAACSARVSSVETDTVAWGGGGVGVGEGVGSQTAHRPDLPRQRHNPGFCAGVWRAEPCLPNQLAGLVPEPRDASLSFFLSRSSLQERKKQSLWVTTKLAPQKLIVFVPPLGIFWEPSPTAPPHHLACHHSDVGSCSGSTRLLLRGEGRPRHDRNLMSWRDLPAQRQLMMGC